MKERASLNGDNELSREEHAKVDELLEELRFEREIAVTRPTMPDLGEVVEMLEQIWETCWLTNNGHFHSRLEVEIAREIDSEFVNLCCNGTTAILLALRYLGLEAGDAITTPFTFPATVHALAFAGFRPVFCDLDPQTMNLDPNRVEECINNDTRLVLPVHVYGTPCDVEAFADIGRHYGIPVVYDAAHAFGVRYRGDPLERWGDMSILSFHATKLFSTIEGGAVVSHSRESKRQIDLLKNFGIADEENVLAVGINGKMNEFEAAFGLLQLRNLSREIEARKLVDSEYRSVLADVPGITLLHRPDDVTANYAHFPVLIDEQQYGLSRDRLHDYLRAINVKSRKYFHPLCSHMPCYRDLPSSSPGNLQVAEDRASRVLCLPIFGTLSAEEAHKVAEAIRVLSAISGR